MSTKFVTLNVKSKFSSSDCFYFEFKVNNFSTVKNVTSSKLVTSRGCGTTFRVLLETTRRVRTADISSRRFLNEGKMRVGLQRTDSNKLSVQASFFFKVLNSRGQVYFSESIEKIFSLTETEFFCDFKRRPGRIAQVTRIRDAEISLLSDDILTVQGYVIIRDGPEQGTMKNSNYDTNLTELQNNFVDLYRNRSLSDVLLRFEESSIHAHKAILSARSPVFKRMFEQQMIENQLNEVQITDIKHCVFEVFLRFLYTGTIERTDFDTTLSLYETADKYEVVTLFTTCSNLLHSYISDGRASVIIKYADMHSDETLKQTTLQFIIEHFATVGETSEWCNLIDSDPRLASYILLNISHSASKHLK